MILINKIISTTLILTLMVFNANAKDELTEGMDAPNFSLTDQDNISRSLEDYKNKWVVIYFYPKMILLDVLLKPAILETI